MRNLLLIRATKCRHRDGLTRRRAVENAKSFNFNDYRVGVAYELNNYMVGKGGRIIVITILEPRRYSVLL